MSTVPDTHNENAAEEIAPVAMRESATVAVSPTRLAWRRFLADKKSVAAGIVVVIYLILGAAAPLLVHTHVLKPLELHQNLINDLSLPTGHLGGISWSHPLGVTPGNGYDVMSRVWYGITLSIFIALSASLISVVVGVVLGIVAGVSGGWVDSIISRFIDLMLCFPQTLMLLALSSVVVGFLTQTVHVPSGDPAQIVFVIVVMGLFGWMSLARLIRGQVLSLREREFVQAARLFGASRRRLWFKEVLPNLWAPILVNFTLMLPLYISTEAALAFLSVSVQPPTPTLGNVLSNAMETASHDAMFFLIPAFLIALIVVAFNLLGDGLRDALDPKGH
jgi:peptide/nickel transport system permease protein